MPKTRSARFQKRRTYRIRRSRRKQRGGSYEMIQAIREKNLAKVQQLISENKGISELGADGVPPLTIALMGKNMPIFEALLAAGSDPNAGEPRWNPLTFAAQEGLVEAVRHLLAANGDPNRVENDRYAFTPLYFAVQNQMNDMVQLLLDAGANPNLGIRYNPLTVAIEDNDVPLVIKLLNAGANPNVYSDVRKKLIQNGQTEMIRALVLHPRFRKETITDDDFGYAAGKGHLDIIRIFVDAGIQFDPNRLGLLNEAVRSQHVDTVRFLLENGADPNFKDYSNRTPLLNLLSICRHITNSNDPLVINLIEITQMLLASGADPNSVDNDSMTPLHFAAHCGNVELGQILLDAGANPNMFNIYGESPQMIAEKKGNQLAQIIPEGIRPAPAAPAAPAANQGANQNEGEYENDGQYENEGLYENEGEYENEGNYEEAVANRAYIPPIPAEMNRPITTRVIDISEETQCYDPYMADTVPIGPDQVQFYIFRSSAANTPELSKVACIDNVGDEDGQPIQLYRKFLDDIGYLYYKCDDSVPEGSMFVSREQIEEEPLRRLAFDSNIYVYESQAQKIQAGRKYALFPTEAVVGRIVSETFLQTGNAVGAEHCQTNYADRIYEIFEIVESQDGGRRRPKRTRKHKRRD